MCPFSSLKLNCVKLPTIFQMTSSISNALPESHIFLSSTKLTTTTVEQQQTQLWEMIVVVSCPVLFVIFLCCCIICMIIKNHDRRPTVEPLRRSNLATIMRQLPPPPKYDVAVASSQTPPPMYADIEKGVVFDPLHSLSPQSSAPSSPTSPEVSLFIQYLYPPCYEMGSSESTVSSTLSPSRTPIDIQSLDSSLSPPSISQIPSVTNSVISTPNLVQTNFNTNDFSR